MKIRRLLPLVLLLALFPSAGWAATSTADTTGNWNVAANWDNGDTLPVATNDVVIPNGITITLDGVRGGAGFLSVLVQNGGTLLIDPTVDTGLVLAGDSAVGFQIAAGGTLGMVGGAAVEADHTCTISITPATDGGLGMILSGTVSLLGAPKTHFLLAAGDIGDWTVQGDAHPTVADYLTVVLTGTPSGWRDHDLIVAAPTGRLPAHWDICRLNGAPADANVVVEGWLDAAEQAAQAPLYAAGTQTHPQWCHQGAGTPAQARSEVLNLTRNVKVFSTDPTKRTYIAIGGTAAVVMNYIEIYNLQRAGGSGNAFGVLTTTGSFASTGMSVHNSAWIAPYIAGLTTGTVSLTNGISWLINTVNVAALTTSGAGSCTFSNYVAANSSGIGFSISDVSSTFPSCRAVGNVSDGVCVSEANATVVAGLIDGFVSHSNGVYGVDLQSNLYIPKASGFNGVTSWRNASAGLNAGLNSIAPVWWLAPVSFGNGTAQVLSRSGGPAFVTNPTEGETVAAYQTTSIAQFGYGTPLTIWGGAVRGTPTIGSVPVTVIGSVWTTFAAPTSFCDLGSSGVLQIFRFNNVADDHRFYYKYGTVRSYTTADADRHTASGMSWEHFPLGGVNQWFEPNQTFYTRARANTAVTIKAWVKRNVGLDGTILPRINVKGGYLAGVGNVDSRTCTVQNVGDTVTYNGHGHLAGTMVRFQTSENGLTKTTQYYVITPTANTFQVALTVGGAAVAITSDGTMVYNATDIAGTSMTAAAGTWQQISSVTVTPTENGYLPWIVAGQGTAGHYMVDDVSSTGTYAYSPEDTISPDKGFMGLPSYQRQGWW